MLENARVVDLTIPLGPDIVMWPGAPAPEAETLVTIAHDGYFARRVSLFEHSGTHFDAPCHFIEGGRTVEQVPASTLVAPIVMIDVSSAMAGNPDAVLALEQVRHRLGLLPVTFLPRAAAADQIDVDVLLGPLHVG